MGEPKPSRETRPRDLWLFMAGQVVVSVLLYLLLLAAGARTPEVVLGAGLGGAIGGLIGYRIRRGKDRARRQAHARD